MAQISKVKYLGYSFYRYKGKCRFRVHPKSVAKMKDKIRELTDRKNNGISNVVREEMFSRWSVMLNDAVCFKAVYIVCVYTDLRSGMDRLAAIIEARTGNNPYVLDTLYLFCGRRPDRIQGLV